MMPFKIRVELKFNSKFEGRYIAFIRSEATKKLTKTMRF